MPTSVLLHRNLFIGWFAGLLVLCVPLQVCAQASSSAELVIETLAERRLVRPSSEGPQMTFVAANEVHIGDDLFYTLRVRNASDAAVENPVIVKAMPRNTVYVDQSAVGPATIIEFSIDGGSVFAAPDELSVVTSPDMTRAATTSDYTHIRWRLRHPLAAGATALLRFRGVFK
jgi:uncharacterized repeat protein (TIGR01451 family)